VSTSLEIGLQLAIHSRATPKSREEAGYTKFFGTKEQPNKPARNAMQVAALAAPGALVEIEVIAVRPH
jgi:enamine deaminase RidA (YjgF/YER057c/UK114 family)